MRILLKHLPIICILAFATPSVCQLSVSNIYCFDMDQRGNDIELKNARFLTGFNSNGYNNQPQWINNNEIYISVLTPYDTNQTEIYSLSLLNNILTQVTATRESEYSPTLMPDRRNFSCVRVDDNNKATQRLWTYPLDRSNIGRDLLPLHHDVGYHCWLSDKKLALFIVNPKGNYLKIVNVDDQSSVQLSTGIGRSLARLNDGKLAYVYKSSADVWLIKSMDPITYASENIIQAIPGSEDFVVLPDGTFIMGNGSKLYAYKLGNPERQWFEIADLARYGLNNIKRLAVSRESDKIVIVNNITQN